MSAVLVDSNVLLDVLTGDPAWAGRAEEARVAPLPNFFFGAHAAVAGYTLLIRDAARYRTYYPGVTLIAPSQRKP